MSYFRGGAAGGGFFFGLSVTFLGLVWLIRYLQKYWDRDHNGRGLIREADAAVPAIAVITLNLPDSSRGGVINECTVIQINPVDIQSGPNFNNNTDDNNPTASTNNLYYFADVTEIVDTDGTAHTYSPRSQQPNVNSQGIINRDNRQLVVPGTMLTVINANQTNSSQVRI